MPPLTEALCAHAGCMAIMLFGVYPYLGLILPASVINVEDGSERFGSFRTNHYVVGVIGIISAVVTIAADAYAYYAHAKRYRLAVIKGVLFAVHGAMTAWCVGAIGILLKEDIAWHELSKASNHYDPLGIVLHVVIGLLNVLILLLTFLLKS